MKTFKALLNGHEVDAIKVSGRWLIGGDFMQSGDSVSIALPSKRHDNRLAWFSLKGCYLKFDDFLGENELES